MRLLPLVAVLTIFAVPLQAQYRRHRSDDRTGFFVGFGLAGGSIGETCDGCTSDRTYGPAGYFKIGGMLNRHWGLGGELAGWSLSDQGVQQSVGTAMFDAFWYPNRRGGFFLKLGVGALGYQSDYTDFFGVFGRTRESAAALTIGAGFDIRVGRQVALVPFFNGYGSAPVRRTVDGTEVLTGGDVRRDMVQLGVGLTFR